MSNEVFFGNDAILEMKKGVDVGANSLKVTMGYGGRTVYLKKKGFVANPTKDGYSVIKEINLKDELQNAGLSIIQEGCSETLKKAGDGTTATGVLMQEIITEGLKYKQAGVNPIEFRIGMEKAAQCIYGTLNKIKKPVNKNTNLLKQVACISANNNIELGELIGSVYDKIGRYGTVYVLDGKSSETTIEQVDGFEFLGGYYSEHFINTAENTCELINPYILVCDNKVSSMKDIFPIFEKVATLQRSIVVIADDYDYNVLRDTIKNIGSNKLKCLFIKQNFSGVTKDELLLDLCAVTGATLISDKISVKFENIDLSYLGQCESVKTNKTETTIFNGVHNKKLLNLRVADAKNKIKDASNEFTKEKSEYRLAKLLGNVAICYVGGATDGERKERKDRIDDALKATKCALEEGIVIGGGAALIKCIDALSKLKYSTEDEKSGIRLVQKSIEKPLFQICKNAGVSGELMVEKVKESKITFGYNCKTKKIEDLFAAGIIDPAKVVRVIVENAVSGAVQFLIAECAIVELND